MEKWPNFFLVGTPKAGTTSLYEYLKNIPGIYMSPIKEPNYFSVNTVPNNHPVLKPIRDKETYLKLFEKVSNEKIIGESSPDYLADQDAPSLIHQIVPHAHILISLRDPVERAFSDYLIHVRQGLMKLSFHDELQKELRRKIDKSKPNCRLDYGFYFESVKRYLNIFGSNQVKIIIFEEFIQNTKTTIKEILHFLDLNYPMDNFDDKIHNPYQGPRGSVAQHILTSNSASKISKKILPSSTRRMIRERILVGKKPKPEMDPQDRETLVKFYEEDVKKLETLLGRKLPWKNFSKLKLIEKWPNFFIVGAPKAGTTSLYEYLKNITDIYMSPIKEPNYFSINTVTENFLTKPIRDKKQYLKLFEKVTNEKIIGESSPEYLADQDAPSSIHQISPDANILICLRDPVERAYSHYLMLANFDQTKLSFKLQIEQELEKKIDKILPNLRLYAGMYSGSVKRYLKVFGTKQVKVIIFEEFIQNTKATIEEILHFLDLNYSIDNFDNKIHNPSKSPRGSVAQYFLTSKTGSKIAKKILSSSIRKIIRERILVGKKPKPEMDPQDRSTLVKFYEEDVKKLETLLGRKLPWKNFSTT